MRIVRHLLLLALSVCLASCARSGGLSGTYKPTSAATFQSLTFKSDGKVDIGLIRGGMDEGSYVRDGTSVKITVQDQTQIFALDANGCLDGGTAFGKYCKDAAASKTMGAVSSADSQSVAGSSGDNSQAGGVASHRGSQSAGGSLSPLSPQPLATEPVIPPKSSASHPTAPSPGPGKPDSPAVAAAILAPSPMLGAYVATAGKGVTMTLEFLDARNVRMTVAGGGPTAVQEGTYKLTDDGHILVTIQNDTAEFSRIDNGLEGKLDNAVVKFIKSTK